MCRLTIYRLLGVPLLLGMLGGCQLALPGSGGAPAVQPIANGGAIITTSLDTPVNEVARAAIAPKPRPQQAPVAAELPIAAPAAPAIPEVLKSAAQISCERSGGSYENAGNSGARACVQRTRDAGKQCRKAGDCEGACLARSRSCAPITPLFGCNEVLQNDGRQVTLCIE